LLPTFPTRDPRADLATRPAYLLLLAVLPLHFVLGGALQAASAPFGLAFGEVFFFALPPLFLVRAMNYRPGPFLGLGPTPRGSLPWVIAVAGAGFFFAGSVNALNRLLVGEELARRFDVTHLFEGRSPAEAALLVAAVSILAPIGEELLFRGYLLRVLGARYGAFYALTITSLLFALLHLNPASLLALFALGVVFGILRLATGSIWPSILAHAVQNGVSSVLVLAGVVNESPDELPLVQALALLVVALPFVAVPLARLWRRRGPTEDPPPLDPERGHAVRLAAVARPLALALAAALGSLALWVAVGGPGPRWLLRRLAGPGAGPAPEAAPPLPPAPAPVPPGSP
jgi:membrane protease YdiL (CAAX protease family)